MLIEPVTSVTDLVLSILAGFLAAGMYRRCRRTRSQRDALWVAGMAALAASTFLGAMVHGFTLGAFRDLVWLAIWSLAAICNGCFVLAALFAVLGDREGRRPALYAAVLLAALFWRTYLVADRLVLYDCITLTIATTLYVYLHLNTGERRLLAIPLATATLVAGALLQVAGASFTFIWHFNQNDIFHLAMMVALPAYYVGADPDLLPPSSLYGGRLPAKWVRSPRWDAAGLLRRRDSD